MKSLAFEKEMAKRFESAAAAAAAGGDGGAAAAAAAAADEDGEGGGSGQFDESAPLYNDKGDLVDPACAEGIKLKHRRKKARAGEAVWA